MRTPPPRYSQATASPHQYYLQQSQLNCPPPIGSICPDSLLDPETPHQNHHNNKQSHEHVKDLTPNQHEDGEYDFYSGESGNSGLQSTTVAAPLPAQSELHDPNQPGLCRDGRIWAGLCGLPVALLTALVAIALVTFPSPERSVTPQPRAINQPILLISICSCFVAGLYVILGFVLTFSPCVPICYRDYHGTKTHPKNNNLWTARPNARRSVLVFTLVLLITSIVLNLAMVGISSWAIHDFCTHRVIPPTRSPSLGGSNATSSAPRSDNFDASAFPYPWNKKIYPVYSTYPNVPFSFSATPLLSGLTGAFAVVSFSVSIVALVQTVRGIYAFRKAQRDPDCLQPAIQSVG